jgi:anion-transporting  ArsA/GET3 family ATPase
VAAAVINRVMPETIESHFWQTRRQQEAKYLREIEREFATLSRIYLPLLPCDVRGISALEKIGRLLVE